MTRTIRRDLLIGVAALLTAGGLVALLYVIPSGSGEQNLTTPEAVASEFAAAYAAGDTGRACQLAAGQAHDQLDRAGQCRNGAGWSTTAQQTRTCYLPTRDAHSFEYRTEEPVNAHAGFDITITGSGSTWKVTTLTTHTGESLCSVYGR